MIQHIQYTNITMRRLVHFTQLDSTNAYCKTWTSKSKPICSTAILADYQRHGRGRGTNAWIAEKGKNITVSFTHPKLAVHGSNALKVHFKFALCLQQMLKKYDLDCLIKWPNDLMCAGKKIAGILSENQFDKAGNSWLVLGLGINVNQTTFGALDQQATSCAQVLGYSLPLHEVLDVLWDAFDISIAEMEKHSLADICREISENLYRKGELGIIDQGGIKIMGTIIGLHDDGRLILRKKDQEVQYIAAGNLML